MWCSQRFSSGLHSCALGVLAGAAVFVCAAGAAAQTTVVPTPDECITDVSPTPPGQPRRFQCAGDEVSFFVSIPQACSASSGCGLITNLPGATQTAASAEANLGLEQRVAALALPRPFVVISAQRDRPQGPPIFGANSDDEVFAFMQRAARVFAADLDRIHIGGFSQGGGITFSILCDPQRASFIASAAPAASAPADPQCFGAGAAFENPSAPILYFSGTQDTIAAFERQAAAAEAIVSGIGPVQSTTVIDQGVNGFTQTRITGANGRTLELIRYDNVNARLGGHCFPGPAVPNGGGCDGPTAFEIGAKTLEFYVNNPKSAQ
jgi:poly(3-hydroxybutyrate) depolymerase